MSTKSKAVISAAFGGMAPNLLHLAINLTGGKPVLPEWTFFLGVFLFAMMGAGIAMIWNEIDLKKAFYLGLGLPSLIQYSAGQIDTEARVNTGALLNTFIAPAFAQPVVATPERLPRMIHVRYSSTAGRPTRTYQIVFLSADQKKETHVGLASRKAALPRPVFAAAIAVRVGNSRSPTHPLSRFVDPEKPESPARVHVDVRKRFGSGFLEALGFKHVQNYEIALSRWS